MDCLFTDYEIGEMKRTLVTEDEWNLQMNDPEVQNWLDLRGGYGRRSKQGGTQPNRNKIVPQLPKQQLQVQLQRKQAWIENLPERDQLIEKVLHPSILYPSKHILEHTIV